MARNDLPGTTLEEIAAAFQKLVDEEDAILLEDLAILGNYRDITLHLDPTVEVHTRADRLSLAWRRLMADAFFSAA